MHDRVGTITILRLLIVLISYPVCAFASDPPSAKPVATLFLSQGESTWATVAYASEASIAVGLCQSDSTNNECLLSLVRWEGGNFRVSAQTRKFDSGISIHPGSGGQILAGRPWLSKTILYSADLSTTHELPSLWHVSQSGKTVAETARGSWKLYRLTDRLEPFREGTGDLRSVSDEAAVIQDGKVIKVETLDGRQLGSFSVSDRVLGSHSALLGNNKLYIADCRSTVSVVNFEGKTQLKMHQPGLCGLGDTTSSADGRRILFDFTSRKVNGLQNVLESVRTVTTLGMAGEEDFNREEVRAVDTVTGKTCFSWHRSFPMTYDQIRSAAISPSGEYVAIATGNVLSIYRLPPVC